MSRIEALDRDEVGEEVRAIYDEIEAAFGMVPNLFKTYAHFPALLRVNWEKTRVLMLGGRLPRTLKEMIAVVVSRANACRYCVAAHEMMLRQLGFGEERLRSLEESLEGAGLSGRDRAILSLVRKSTRAPSSVAEGEVEQLKDCGLSAAEIVEIQGVMELFTGYNKFIDSLALELDFEAE